MLTGLLGTDDSQLGNIELGLAPQIVNLSDTIVQVEAGIAYQAYTSATADSLTVGDTLAVHGQVLPPAPPIANVATGNHLVAKAIPNLSPPSYGARHTQIRKPNG